MLLAANLSGSDTESASLLCSLLRHQSSLVSSLLCHITFDGGPVEPEELLQRSSLTGGFAEVSVLGEGAQTGPSQASSQPTEAPSHEDLWQGSSVPVPGEGLGTLRYGQSQGNGRSQAEVFSPDPSSEDQ